MAVFRETVLIVGKLWPGLREWPVWCLSSLSLHMGFAAGAWGCDRRKHGRGKGGTLKLREGLVLGGLSRQQTGAKRMVGAAMEPGVVDVGRRGNPLTLSPGVWRGPFARVSGRRRYRDSTYPLLFTLTLRLSSTRGKSSPELDRSRFNISSASFFQAPMSTSPGRP